MNRFDDFQLDNRTFSFLLNVYNFLQEAGLKSSQSAHALIENAGVVGITFTETEEMDCRTRNQKLLNCKIAAANAADILSQIECDMAFNLKRASLIEEASEISQILNNFVQK